jgi:endogenous inhibitor of DNA gyrase (YacG/DUF329 family)
VSRQPPVKTVRCPACRREVRWEENPFAPFCSERCSLIDLGEWISEGYRIRSDEEEGQNETPIDEEE